MSPLNSWRDQETSILPVMVTYRVKPGLERQFEELLGQHWPLLQDMGLVTKRPAYLLRSQTEPQVYIEIFDWNDKDAMDGAHQLMEIQELWAKMKELTEDEGGIQPVHYDAV